MSQEPSPAGERFETWPDLRSKPQRRSQWRPFPLLLLFGCLLVIGAGTFLVWHFASLHSQAAPTQQKSTAPTHPPPVRIDCKHYPSSYHDTLRQELAEELHLTVAQVTAQIRAGKTLQDVAAAQNISADQLFDLERFAYKVIDGQLVQGGCMSQDIPHQQFNESASDLNHDFTRLFS